MAKTAVMKVWDVELGLSIHVEAPNGKYIVIDLGSKYDVNPLKTLSGKEVGYMVITHPHHDHFSDIKNIDCARPSVLWRVRAYTREELIKGVRMEELDDFDRYCDFCESYTGTLQSKNDPTTTIPFDGLTADVFYTWDCDKVNKNNRTLLKI